MTIFIRQAHIVDPNSSHHGTRQNVFIQNGKIVQIGQFEVSPADQTIDHPNLHLSPGWVDCFAHFCDPGLEYKETIETGIKAAAAGGFTEVMVLPNTLPVVSGKSQVEYIIQKSKNTAVTIHPLGAVTKQTEGKELAEMYDMKSAGAVAFTDGLLPVQSAGLLLKALQYVKAFNGVIIQIPDDQSVGRYGLMNEGVVSTRLGLPGKPMLAEEVQVNRDIELTRYADSALHFTGITSPESLAAVKRARNNGIHISCSVSPAHLFFTDEALTSYDTNLKLFPPLRTAAVQHQLRRAVLDGGVDCIASHHLPHEFDSKVCEFEYAKPGMISLETCYGVVGAALGEELMPERWVELVSINPRRIFGLNLPAIQEGQTANVTLFDPSATYVLTDDCIRSRSRNTPFTGKEMKGKVIGIIHNNIFTSNI